jgi:5-oxoprolinase (ATP-hydrolysing) subunit A
VRVDLNADIGEFASIDDAESDRRLLRSITSANIACGFHAGNPAVMRHTVRLAAQAGVAVGAHPGFQDVEGFGRREMHLEPDEITNLVVHQVEALRAIASSEGVRLRHVKPHGALYNMASRDTKIAEAIASAIASFDLNLRLVGLPRSQLLSAGTRVGLSVAAEAFADRSYEPDGSLTPRHIEGAVLTDLETVVERAVRMVRDGEVLARDGSIVPLKADTLCVHGDTRGAAELAAAVRAGLEQAGVTVASL